MKRFYLAVLAFVFCFAPPALVLAEEEERIEHYAAEVPQTQEEALELLNRKTEETGAVIAKESLGGSDLEYIHEISYSLEAAVDKLRAARGHEIDTLDEIVQALHYASESHDEAKTREWFARLGPAIAALGSAFSETPVKKDEYEIVIKNHQFSPAELHVPAREKIKLKIDNRDPAPEEFESHDLGREKIVGGHSRITIFIGPLEPGKYHYFGEFNMDTANGYIIAE